MGSPAVLANVLVIRLGALGDVLHTLPAVRALAAAGATVDYLTDPGAAPLVEGQPDIRAVIRYDRLRRDRGPVGFARLALRLRAARYDGIVDLQGSFRTRLLALAAGAACRVRYRKDPPGTPRHAVDNFVATLAPFGLDRGPGGAGTELRGAGAGGSRDASGSSWRAPRFVPSPAARAAVEAVLAGAGVPSDARLVALHPGATHPVNRWRPERFGTLAARLAAQPGVAVVVTGAAADRPLVEAVLCAAIAAGAPGCAPAAGTPAAKPTGDPAAPLTSALAEVRARSRGGQEQGPLSSSRRGEEEGRPGADGRPPLYDLAGRLDLAALGALFTRCAVVVAGDTGPLHLAAAVGAPTVALFGAADPVRTGPIGEGHRIVLLQLDCVPCRARRCRRVDRVHACMEELTVEAVEAAVLAALATGAAGGGAAGPAAAAASRPGASGFAPPAKASGQSG